MNGLPSTEIFDEEADLQKVSDKYDKIRLSGLDGFEYKVALQILVTELDQLNRTYPDSLEIDKLLQLVEQDDREVHGRINYKPNIFISEGSNGQQVNTTWSDGKNNTM